MKNLAKNNFKFIVFLFAVTYMVSYITRINYGAIISEMESATAISRSLLSVSLTGSFITYGIGQVISGIIGDRFSPKRIVASGLCLSVAMNLLIPFCNSAYQMIIIWCVNGFAQSLLWPPMVRMMTAVFDPESYKNAVSKMSWGSSFGTIAVYLISPALISLLGWKSVFFFSAACGAVMIALWQRLAPDTAISAPPASHKAEQDSPKAKIALFSPVMLCIMIAIILQGMLRDGVTTWMPSYISDTYNLGNAISILTGVVLPIFSIFCFQIANKLYKKVFTDPLSCSAVFFFAGAISSAGLYFLSGQNAACSVAFSAILTGCMHGVNLMLICMVPNFFRQSGKVSTVSGVLNCCTYIGSSVSTYGVALLSEKLGWGFTLTVWLGIALAGTLICILCIKPWKKRFMA